MIVQCPICNFDNIEVFHKRTDVPIHQHLLHRSVDSALATDRGDLEIAICHRCGFVFNAAFDITRIRYGENYDNNQLYSDAFNKHVDSLVAYITGEIGGNAANIVEVGCGNGAFLKRLASACHSGVTGLGFDPSYKGDDIAADGRIKFIREYYGPEFGREKADIVLSRHVIEHVPDPISLLRTVHLALEGSPNARVFFETPCVDWILENQVIWDFFYEHCSYFSLQSITIAFELAGFDVVSVNHVFGGQYLWLEAKVSEFRPYGIINDYGDNRTQDLVKSFSASFKACTDSWFQTLQNLSNEGALAFWGAGAKGVTFANLVDPHAKLIDCIIDSNIAKQGCYLPGTAHPIISPVDLREYKIKYALLLNPNYYNEVQRTIDEIQPGIKLVDLMDYQRSVQAVHNIL